MFTNIFAPLTERAVSYLIYEHDSLSFSLFETEGGLTRSLTVVEYNNEITTRIIVRAALTPSFFDWTGKMKRWGEVKSLGKLLGWDFLSILRYLVHRRFNTERIVDIYIYRILYLPRRSLDYPFDYFRTVPPLIYDVYVSLQGFLGIHRLLFK